MPIVHSNSDDVLPTCVSCAVDLAIVPTDLSFTKITNSLNKILLNLLTKLIYKTKTPLKFKCYECKKMNTKY